MKKFYVDDIKVGDYVDDIFVLTEKVLSKKRDGNNYLNLTFADKTGVLKGVMWDNVDQLSSNIVSGDFVTVKGNISEYRGDLQFVVKGMSICDDPAMDPSDFLPATNRDIDHMYQRLLHISDTIDTVHLKKLLDAFWEDPEFVKQFKVAPAAKMMHHAYLGGLLEHTLSTVMLADKIAGHYKRIDRDLLITGTILHDVGKIKELAYTIKIDYSDEGRLLSHIVIGTLMVREKIKSLAAFPEETALLLEHMIISHHGSREFGSPEPPKTLEAILLNYIDEIDAKMNAVREFMESEDSTENWTSYHRLLGRHFYKKNQHKQKGNDKDN